MEKPVLRTLLILTGVVTFSISAWSSGPARCLGVAEADLKSLCLAKAQLDVRRCGDISSPLLQQQCQASIQTPF